MNKAKGFFLKRSVDTADEPTLMRAIIDSGSFNADDNTVNVIWASDAPVRKIDLATKKVFNEVLSFEPGAALLERMRAGAPVLNNHQKDGDISAVQIGVVLDAWIEGNRAFAKIKLSSREDVKPIVQDIRDGIIRNVSFGYRVLKYIDITPAGAQLRTLLATSWEASEISFVPVPADYTVGVRSLAEMGVELAPDEAPVSIENENLNNNNRSQMETEVEKEARLERERLEREQVAREAQTAERTRSVEINECVRTAGLEPAFAIEHITAGTSADQVRRLVIAELASRQQNPINPNGGGARVNNDQSRENQLREFEEALSIRSFGVGSPGVDAPVTELGRQIASGTGRRIRLVDYAVRSLESLGINTFGLNDNEIFTRAMTSGDFPLALANVMNKTLRNRYLQAIPQWMKIAKKVSAKDFKLIYSVQVDGNTLPGELTETGDYPYVTFKEAGDNFKLRTFGLTTSVSRQMFINDDLSAFENFAPFFFDGMMYNQTQLVYGALLGADGLGRVLGEDDVKLFNAAAHKNIDTIGAALSIASLEAGKVAMRRQKTLAGRKMNGNVPKFLMVPPELEVQAFQLINSTIVPNQIANANPFTASVEVLVEDFFDDTQSWLLFADPMKTESLKIATLDGQEGIFTDQWWNQKNDCWEVKARNDFDATVEEYRGVYKNVGVAP